jgi:hypothetical protein
LLLDGQVIGDSGGFEQSEGTVEAHVSSAAAQHTIEIVQQLETQAEWAGATISAVRNDGGAPKPVEMQVTPY